MLPLVQMHQMVQTPPHLDPLAAGSFPAHLNPDYFSFEQQQQQQQQHHLSRPSSSYHHGGGGSSQRAFPIRSSQPAHSGHHRNTMFAHCSDFTEHQLRRKTPNGTIDAGYDGTPAQLASGPPPLKQMALPGSSKIFPTAVTHHGLASLNAGHQMPPQASCWPPTPQGDGTLGMGTDGLGLGNYFLGGWRAGQNMVSPDTVAVDSGQSFQQPGYQYTFSHGPRVHTVIPPSFQQAAGPTAWNPVGFNPPPVWRDGGVVGFHSPMPLASMGNALQHDQFDSSRLPDQAKAHHLTSSMPSLGLAHGLQQLSAYPLGDTSFMQQSHQLLQSPHRCMESLSLNSSTPPSTHAQPDGASSPARFKERALARAHKSYAELLIYLSHTKKLQNGKHASSLRSTSKMVVFPRPPKQLTASLTQRHHMASVVPFGTSMKSHGQMQPAAAICQPYQSASQPMLPGYPVIERRHTMAQMGSISSPMHNAKAALDVLSNLCEQSGWKWVDGMLLGGCLHYGLEHYERALEWFNRIVSLDPNHVEAISNVAATLYCLNRLQEAEHHWLQAVTTRPSYLEAVEHLVALLCSHQRSREAVEIINSVQSALRLPETNERPEQSGIHASGLGGSGHDGHQTASGGVAKEGMESASQPGFGSSGYAIPGNENGRMLLLVHAKGNMLYALKEIDRASKSFEEAVLIGAGRHFGGVENIIQRVQAVLAPGGDSGNDQRVFDRQSPSASFLLHPDTAKHTASLVFSATNGQLPGLRFIPEGSHRRSAVSTTSNSLLSLAKIFQDAMSNVSPPPALVCRPSGVGDILALYYLSLSLQESPSTANNVGILLASVQQTYRPVSTATMSATPVMPGVVPGSGLSLALAYYYYGLNLDPKHVHLHTNLGSLLKDIGQLDLAIHMYEQAVACDSTFDIALTNLANAVKDRGRVGDAIMYYTRAVTSNPEFPEAVCGLSTALNSVCDWRGRGGVLLLHGKYDRWHVDGVGMLSDVKKEKRGGGLMKKVVDIVVRQLREASLWGNGILQEEAIKKLASQLVVACPGVVDTSLDLEMELRKWAGQPWEGSRVLRLIERAARAAMRAWYRDRHVLGAESTSGYPRVRLPGSLTVPASPTVLPFHTFTCPLTAKDIRMISQRNALRISSTALRSPWLPSSVYPPPKPPSPALNIGYVSSDFNNHPLAHLMQSVFGFHDQSRAMTFCYATTASDNSIHRHQIEREAPVFRDASSWSSERLINQIIEDGIHILVNLNGYTRGARNEVFAARPAPIQMSFMGFAGTLGAEWCDYLLADTTAIPPETLRPWRGNLGLQDVVRDEEDAETDGWVYSENIIFSRDTFFCCDHRQSADDKERNMSWEDEQSRRWKMRKELFPSLPNDAIIMGNFNQLYKIDPTTFRTWLRILSSVPKAVLWLLRFPELGESNLRRTAMLWAGENVASRLIFTDVAAKQQHISRARVCDIFLDTPECNAHTTAADVLWSSTPLLTLPRYQYKMCSRMAASILKGALPKSPEGVQATRELIAADDREYEQMAVRLASSLSYRITPGGYGEGQGRLAELRELLWRSKWTCALFDTRRWVRDLEDAYHEAWRRWVDGEGGDIYL